MPGAWKQQLPGDQVAEGTDSLAEAIPAGTFLAKGHRSFNSSSRDSEAPGTMAVPLKLITYAGDLDRKQRKMGGPPGDAQGL